MIHLRLPDESVRPLSFYLSMEEWAAKTLAPADYFFAWRVAPTVICGRNQDLESEVNVEYCHCEGIDIVRRRSGGGCVYADMNNFMFSYITPGNDTQAIFGRYTAMIADLLQQLGVEAVVNGRNDIVVGSSKISGNAFYHLPGWSIVHGTVLYDIDSERMSRAITPSKAKLVSKGVHSVPMRVCCLRDLNLGISLEDFGQFIIDKLTKAERILTVAEVKEIEQMSQRYSDTEYLYGCKRNSSQQAFERSLYIEGVGALTATIILNRKNVVNSVALSGDYFSFTESDEPLLKLLKGTLYSRESLKQALGDVNVSNYIAGLNSDNFLDLIID